MSNRRKTRGRPVPPHAQLKPGVYILEIRHDDGCPAPSTQRSATPPIVVSIAAAPGGLPSAAWAIAKACRSIGPASVTP